jgi:hypothetical protein
MVTKKPLSTQSTENKQRKSGRRKLARNSGYGRLPFKVISDQRLELIDKQVYSVLSWAERNGNAYIGERLIGEICEIGREAVRDCIGHLVDRRHVRLRPGGHGQRMCYVLTHPMFAAGPKAVSSEGQAETGLFCGGCQRPMRGAVCDDCRRRTDLADAI